MSIRVASCIGIVMLALSALGKERKAMNVFVRAVDEQSRPVTNAYVIGGSEGNNTCVSKKVNKDGVALFMDATKRKTFEPQIIAPGYYMSEGCFVTMVQLPGTDRDYVVPLRKVINPVLIETKGMDNLIGRAFDKDIGFDLEKLDWVPPHGAGVHTDLVVRASWERIQDVLKDKGPINKGLRSIVTLRTVGAGNGFLPFQAEKVSSTTAPGSVFMLPYQVPVTGLTNELRIVWETYDDLNSTYTEKFESHYAFRVRGHLDGNGTLVNAHVGWIEGQVSAAAAFFPEGSPNGPRPKPSEAVPDRFHLNFIRHWNPNPESNSLEPNTPMMRWENQLSDLIRVYKLQDLPGIEELKPLDRKDPQWIPSPEEVRAERKAEEAERLRQRQEINRANQEKYIRDHPERAAQYDKDHPEERQADVPKP
ncbi:MAG: hypothetical protein U1F87_08150 [Kiritimatiellia bacterium]